MRFVLDSAVKAFLEVAEQSGLPAVNEVPLAVARSQYIKAADWGQAIPEIASAADDAVPGPSGDIPIRIYRPLTETSAPLPVTVFYHGGGWVIGDLESHDPICRGLCHHGECVVVAVDYRLAPEHPFPAAFEDAMAALQWVADHAAQLGTDNSKLAVAGDSAGGNLATVVSIAARDSGGPDIAYQALIYPVTDMSMSWPSMSEFASGYRLTRPLMEWFINAYATNEADRSDPRASPILVEKLAGLPPAVVITAGFDPLRDEGQAYADKLRAAGVAVEYRCYEGMIHGFLTLGGVLDAGREATEWVGKAIKSALCVAK